MDAEAHEDMEKTFRRKARAIICRRCGAMPTTIMDGKDFADGMPGIKYKCCGSCGHKDPKVARQKRERL